MFIVTPNSSFFGNNNWKNIFVIANYYNDIKYSKIWACQVIGNSDYDMPWTLIHDSSTRFYSNNPQKIGTWIDGTPVWRVAFEGHPSSLDYSDKSYSVKDFLSLKNQDNAFVINQNGYGGDADNPNMLDCHPLDNDSAGTFAINDSIKLVFGYIDFVTSANNIS